MNKLLIASGIVSAMVMTGCATNNTQAVDGHPHSQMHGAHKGMKDHHKHGDKHYNTPGKLDQKIVANKIE